jgi:hypothetical protein
MNPLGSSKEIVQNKLIIMYIMQRLDMPVSNNHLTRFVLEKHLMNYFMLQQCLNELCENNLILYIEEYAKYEPGAGSAPDQASHTAAEDPSSSYTLTDAGRRTLQYLVAKIPSGIRKRLDDAIPAVRREIVEDLLITAEYIPESEDKYVVMCKMREKGFTLVELKATVGTKKDALSVCENWKKHSSAIYSEIIKSLTKQRPSDR